MSAGKTIGGASGSAPALLSWPDAHFAETNWDRGGPPVAVVTPVPRVSEMI